MNVREEDVKVLEKPEEFGLDWWSKPTWAWPAHGKQVAVEVRRTMYDTGTRLNSPVQMCECFSVLTDRGEYWLKIHHWRRVTKHAF